MSDPRSLVPKRTVLSDDNIMWLRLVYCPYRLDVVGFDVSSLVSLNHRTVELGVVT